MEKQADHKMSKISILTGREPQGEGNAFYVPGEVAADSKSRKKGGGATSVSNNYRMVQ